MRSFLFSVAVLVVGCATAASGGYEAADAAAGAPDPLDAGPNAPTVDGSSPSLGGDGGPPVVDIDAACASAVSKATTTKLPVDIVWVVDNSASMEPAVAQVNAGLNKFANLVGTKGLDYRVVMLSLRGDRPVTVSGKTRYPVCIAPPLAGGPGCADGPRFLHSSVDMKSTQPLEQLLGTLGQTDGYRAGDERGGTPWSQFLRPEATKTVVVVTDDESRFSAADFEHFAGGANPNNSALVLPPGLLESRWAGTFEHYVFSAIYGWGSTTDPNVECSYPNGTSPPSAGPTYTSLVSRTAGARAKICDGANAWSPFFDAVAQAVVQSSRIACELAIPTPQSGTVDPNAVNVKLDVGGRASFLPKVAGKAACNSTVAWYYDQDAKPTKVILCPAACDAAQPVSAGQAELDIVFGCSTVVR